MTTFKDLRISLPSSQPVRPLAQSPHDVQYEETIEVPVIPKDRPWGTQKWTPPPYWQNLLQEDKKFEIRGFRLIVVGFALFGVIVALIFFWKIVVAVFAMRIILS